MIDPGTCAKSRSEVFRAADLGGRKPAKKKRSVGNPETLSAHNSAEGPGAASTVSPSSIAARAS